MRLLTLKAVLLVVAVCCIATIGSVRAQNLTCASCPFTGLSSPQIECRASCEEAEHCFIVVNEHFNGTLWAGCLSTKSSALFPADFFDLQGSSRCAPLQNTGFTRSPSVCLCSQFERCNDPRTPITDFNFTALPLLPLQDLVPILASGSSDDSTAILAELLPPVVVTPAVMPMAETTTEEEGDEQSHDLHNEHEHPRQHGNETETGTASAEESSEQEGEGEAVEEERTSTAIQDFTTPATKMVVVRNLTTLPTLAMASTTQLKTEESTGATTATMIELSSPSTSSSTDAPIPVTEFTVKSSYSLSPMKTASTRGVGQAMETDVSDGPVSFGSSPSSTRSVKTSHAPRIEPSSSSSSAMPVSSAADFAPYALIITFVVLTAPFV